MGFSTTMVGLVQCPMGVAPTPLMIPPKNMTKGFSLEVFTILDNKPFMNIIPFGVCKSLANPITAALTAAALGALTPGPCIPLTPAPWMPGSPTVQVMGPPILNKDSKLICCFGGVISIQFTGEPMMILVP